MKQMIVMRKDLNMRKGKMIAQGAHASLGAVLPLVRMYPDLQDNTVFGAPLDRPKLAKLKEWLRGPFKKVCVSVDSEQELIDVYLQAEAQGMIACLITDSGLTEFNGIPTRTCCAIGPDTDEALAPITGELRLL